MTEIKPGETCVLWVKTADLVKDYGYEMSQNCPMAQVCTGTRCAFLDPIKTLATQDAINTERKLNNLREELKQWKD